MRLFILALIVVIVILATVFRVGRARRTLALARDLITLYALTAVALAIFYTWRDGF